MIKNKTLDIKIIFKILKHVKNILGFQIDFYSTNIREQFSKITPKNYFSLFYFRKWLSNILIIHETIEI